MAREWVSETASQAPGFCGAFFHGSTNWLADDAPLPATSDLDVMVVRADPNPAHKPGKFIYRDVLLEVSYLPSARLQSPEMVLGDYHLAGSFSLPSIIADPAGQLARLQAAVSKDYARREWVTRRCAHARNNVVAYVRSLHEPAPLHEQAIAWLFACGITTHVLLVAGLKNPTVRRRYGAARALLAEYGREEFYERLLELLGCEQLSRARAEQHLAALAVAFDAAAALIKTAFTFASDISKLARPVAIGGSRELIERGEHREAVFWIAVTYSRCQQVFYADAPVEARERFAPGYRELLADLGITSFADLRRRCAEVERALPRVWEVAEGIMAANPEIEL